jgi:hypothetical protein
MFSRVNSSALEESRRLFESNRSIQQSATPVFGSFLFKGTDSHKLLDLGLPRNMLNKTSANSLSKLGSLM